jgi:hypothetical protein
MHADQVNRQLKPSDTLCGQFINRGLQTYPLRPDLKALEDEEPDRNTCLPPSR